MKTPVRVAVTGAAGQIGYALLFRIASGEMLGKDQPVILQMLELPMEKAQAALKGVMMELEDCAFPLLAGMVGTDDPKVAFKDADYALLVGAMPRGPGTGGWQDPDQRTRSQVLGDQQHRHEAGDGRPAAGVPDQAAGLEQPGDGGVQFGGCEHAGLLRPPGLVVTSPHGAEVPALTARAFLRITPAWGHATRL